jgi:hypothetical protein
MSRGEVRAVAAFVKAASGGSSSGEDTRRPGPDGDDG